MSAVAAMLVTFATAAPRAQAQSEYQVKAAIIYNIARFVDWPPPGRSTVTLCILGVDPFGSGIDVLAGRPVGAAALQVRRIARPDEARGCQLVFVGGSEAPRLKSVLNALPQGQVLTLADTPGFAESGVAVNLYLEEGRVRFEVNIDAAQRSGLAISSQLLKLARITHDRSRANG